MWPSLDLLVDILSSQTCEPRCDERQEHQAQMREGPSAQASADDWTILTRTTSPWDICGMTGTR